MTHINRRKALTAIGATTAVATLGAGLTIAANAAPARNTPGPRSFGFPVAHDLYEPEYPKGCTAIIDPDLEPSDDDLVLVKFDWKVFPVSLSLLPYRREAGHDIKSRFCQPGDPREVVANFGCLVCTREVMASHVEILGTARGWFEHYPAGRVA